MNPLKDFNPQLTRNWNIVEFACKDGTQVPWNLLANAQKLAKNLQVLRDALGVKIVPNSVYRNPTYNKQERGELNSMHLQCLAADMPVKGYTPRQVAAKIEELIKAGKMDEGGIGIYPTFVHYDCRGYKARWNG